MNTEDQKYKYTEKHDVRDSGIELIPLETGLPRTCVPASKIEDDCYDWWARHEAKLRETAAGDADVLFWGDSLTHFWCAESGVDNSGGLWNDLYGDLRVINLGFGFDRTQNVLWRIENGELGRCRPSLMVVNIGTNQFSVSNAYDGDTPEDAAAGVQSVVFELHDRTPDAIVLLMALFPRAGREREIARTNEILRFWVPSIPWVVFMDIGGVLGTESGRPRECFYCPDLCHINRSGYQVWAAAIAPWISRFCRRRN